MTETVDLTSRAGKVDWELLKRELMSMPKETLAELVNVWLKTFWSLQNYWMVFTEEESGFETAAKLDGKVVPWLEGKRIVKEIVVPGRLVNFVVK